MATPRTDRELAKVQLERADKEAVTEGNVVEGTVVEEGETIVYDYVELKGEKFRIRPKVGALAMFKWSNASELSSDDPRALGAIYAMLKSLIMKEDWTKFEDHALDNDADAEELLDVIKESLEVVGGRPTQPS